VDQAHHFHGFGPPLLLFRRRQGLSRDGYDPNGVDDHHQPSSAMNFGIVVRRMVRDMAVDQPFTGPARGPDHVIPLPGSHIDGDEACDHAK
jgi:hypothetical protein